MDNAPFVSSFQRLGDLFRNPERFVERDRAARDAIGQCFAVNEFKNKETGVAELLYVVNAGDVRMIQRGEKFRFALKPGSPGRVARELFRQDLDGDFALQLEIPCAIHLAHATFAKQGRDFMEAELCTDGQSHDFAGDYKT